MVKNKKYIARTAAEILGSGFALEEQNVYLPRKPESQAHAVALAAAGHRRHRHRRFALCAGADTGTRHGLLVVTVLYAFLTIQVDGSSILDFLRRAACFLFLRQQYYEWRLDP